MRECFATSDFENLSFGSMSLSFWTSFLEVILDDKAYLRSEDSVILSSAFVWIRIKLAASCPLRLLSQATSVPCPPSNINHRTCFFVLSSHRTAPSELSTDIPA
ncbi:hypothetical protein ATANTOWER_023561 [Ataeniobius toweri]|uniref:Uncharacterized protein n=1 Tax=Ataeniobius toweri TaxID=208326 RepID=A0ABU7CM50_9TELE|nr:hypothetical protein [Ataeniobius toweri]